MIRIPNDNKRFSITNSSDLFGNVWYTKNMNFDEEGYAKLSSRTFSFKSEKDDSNFNLPISFGRANGEFHIVTADQAFDLSILPNDFSITEDTNSNNPTLSFDSWGKWFNNKWHATTATKIWHTTGGSWTDSGASVTSGFVHPLEVFRSKNSICVGNGNTVQILDTSYATTATLTIPADFEVIALAYSSFQMGVVTMMSDTAAGQNQDAYFFVWDGAGSSASRGYPIGSDTIMSIVAYKSSWLILTRTGELKYFNGGGFDTLATLPFYNIQTTWGDSQNRETHGDVMFVEGDLVYINLGNDLSVFGKNGESYMTNYPAGIWCYDPKVGFYHRYSPSISTGYQVSCLSAGVNTTTNIITASSGTLPITGNPIKYINNASSLIGGLTIGKVYFIIRHTSTTFSLAETRQDAIDGNKIDLTASNDGNFIALNVLDYGASKGDRTGGIGLVETRTDICDHLLFGVEIDDYNSTSDYQHLQLTTPFFENRGYLVSVKVASLAIEDSVKKLYLKHSPLDVNDKIIVKYKNKDILDLPTNTPQFVFSSNCSWTSSTTFTTISNLSMVKTYLDSDTNNECEVEVISGAGAGSMAQISSISENTGTYTVTLAEEIVGAESGNVCNVSIDNWKLLKTDANDSEISYNNTKGWEEFPLPENSNSSKWVMFKVELRGSETKIEELLIINKTQIDTK